MAPQHATLCVMEEAALEWEKEKEREGERKRSVLEKSSRAAINTDCYIISIVS